MQRQLNEGRLLSLPKPARLLVFGCHLKNKIVKKNVSIIYFKHKFR